LTDLGDCAKASGHNSVSTKRTGNTLLLIAHLLLKLSLNFNGLSQNRTRRAEAFDPVGCRRLVTVLAGREKVEAASQEAAAFIAAPRKGCA
jgi:hypothetical protein